MAIQQTGTGLPYPTYTNETGADQYIGFGVYVNEEPVESAMKMMDASSPYVVRRVKTVSY